MRPLASAACAAAIAVAGAAAAGWPTSMWIIRRPAASSRAAAAITSITMNGGTSLRAEAAAGSGLYRASTAFEFDEIRCRSTPAPPRCCRIRPVSWRAAVALRRRAGLVLTAPAPSVACGRDLGIDVARDDSARSPSKAAAGGPASRVVAFATAVRIARSLRQRAGAGADRAQRRPADHPRRRDRATVARLYRSRSCTSPGSPAQHPRRHHQRQAFNAFVVDAKRIFVNAGALMEAQTPNQIIGVLAHETGHIAGGHLTKMRQELANAQTAAIVGDAARASAPWWRAPAPAATTGQSRRRADRRAAGADHALAARLSARRKRSRPTAPACISSTMTGQSAKGMYDTFKRFADQIAVRGAIRRSLSAIHPMPAERMAALANLANDARTGTRRTRPNCSCATI